MRVSKSCKKGRARAARAARVLSLWRSLRERSYRKYTGRTGRTGPPLLTTFETLILLISLALYAKVIKNHLPK